MARVAASCAALLVLTATLGGEPFRGRVLTRDGSPVSKAILISSDREWSETAPDGGFEMQRHGAFLSVQHPQFKPILLDLDGHANELELVLEPNDDTVWRLPACPEPARTDTLIGGGLILSVMEKNYRGPIHGEHDSHWYVDYSRNETLHLAHWLNGHFGLPLESWLARSSALRLRGWVSDDDQYGLDLRGDLPNGKRWRWVGAILVNSISYYDVSDEGADYFDAIIDTACSGRSTFLRHAPLSLQ